MLLVVATQHIKKFRIMNLSFKICSKFVCYQITFANEVTINADDFVATPYAPSIVRQFQDSIVLNLRNHS